MRSGQRSVSGEVRSEIMSEVRSEVMSEVRSVVSGQVSGQGVQHAHSEQAVVVHTCQGHTLQLYQLYCLSRTEG